MASPWPCRCLAADPAVARPAARLAAGEPGFVAGTCTGPSGASIAPALARAGRGRYRTPGIGIAFLG
jgi:hypothetical protein